MYSIRQVDTSAALIDSSLLRSVRFGRQVLFQILNDRHIHNVGIDLRSSDTFVPKQLLYGCNIDSLIYYMNVRKRPN